MDLSRIQLHPHSQLSTLCPPPPPPLSLSLSALTAPKSFLRLCPGEKSTLGHRLLNIVQMQSKWSAKGTQRSEKHTVLKELRAELQRWSRQSLFLPRERNGERLLYILQKTLCCRCSHGKFTPQILLLGLRLTSQPNSQAAEPSTLHRLRQQRCGLLLETCPAPDTGSAVSAPRSSSRCSLPEVRLFCRFV